MRNRFFITFFISVFFASCQSDSSKSAAEESKPIAESETVKNIAADPVYAKGLGLVAQSDCLTCHKIDDKLIGPSYKEIALKYKDAPNDVVSALAEKIVKGGVGNWGNVPMTPHPSISQEDAETMIRYILLLN